jgi:hypothetical protein
VGPQLQALWRTAEGAHHATQQKKSQVDIKHGNSSSTYLHSALAFFLMFFPTFTGHIIANSWLLSDFFTNEPS